MNNMNILPILNTSQIESLITVIRDSFQTVANDFNLTPINAPTNPAFITYPSLLESIDRGLIFFGGFQNDQLISCIAIEDSKKDQVFYIERLAVLPQHRHHNYGKQLMDFACNEIVKRGGKTVSIGIVNENTILKNWYLKYGFSEVSTKTFYHLPFTVCFMKKEL